MGLLLLLLALIPTPEPSADALMNFARLSKALGHQIALVEQNGTVREGRLVDSAVDAATVEFASGRHVFSRDQIASVTRLKDSTRDGVIKGLLIGALFSASIMGYPGDHNRGALFLQATAVYGAIGWALDAVNTNRQPIYRAATPKPQAAARLTLRF